ncbi:hypothetical protein [Parageobacillus thermoglucosidasius]|uniref:hypothetical protein n=1 Tax=Parageobacillus thermoglucosidasius TaxID=1426 RepID=UPI0001D17A91|nr:hypothetical protein [Parageobacillus thermoglucosidasius]AEH48505.1 hypothetical protein Geoth_2617 [Parageobacillus thermoglucosidasius C56-YS93]
MTVKSYSYSQMKNHLLNKFEKSDYISLYNQKKQERYSVLSFQDVNGRSSIDITFPGYKAEIKNNKVTKYDFRVNIVKENLNIDTPPSHVNIIVDLYNKVQKDNSLYNDLRIFLHNLSLDNDLDPFRNTKLLEYPYENTINMEVINLTENIHRRLGKTYNKNGNYWNYSFTDLAHCIKWIVLQEDINYPIRNGKLGRKMPFSRYFEAIFVAVNHSHTLEEVVTRALQHYTRPANWRELDYSFLNDIK